MRLTNRELGTCDEPLSTNPRLHPDSQQVSFFKIVSITTLTDGDRSGLHLLA
ncbi:hypothetical protein [Chamaesiphon sp. VAR_69_metabat_338]|uniref:hypothetical protein n=1 Tax=Chamaesiphon sp. VAR_69_metabat_338 TaxID=2964704 RepID=UPI00286DABAF|nr:hypothetical protein [Chamaesiphon sp. VAR_69_metabat_338]